MHFFCYALNRSGLDLGLPKWKKSQLDELFRLRFELNVRGVRTQMCAVCTV